MSLALGTYTEGKVVLDAPAGWPEGSRVEVRQVAPEVIMMTEAEQSDDPESIARWVAAFDAAPPPPKATTDEGTESEWGRKVREFNVEAVRRQMDEGVR